MLIDFVAIPISYIRFALLMLALLQIVHLSGDTGMVQVARHHSFSATMSQYQNMVKEENLGNKFLREDSIMDNQLPEHLKFAKKSDHSVRLGISSE